MDEKTVKESMERYSGMYDLIMEQSMKDTLYFIDKHYSNLKRVGVNDNSRIFSTVFGTYVIQRIKDAQYGR